MEGLQRELGMTCGLAPAADHHDVRERRVRGLHDPALGEFLLSEAFEVGLACELNRRTVRGVSLDEDLALALAAARAPGHLREKLEGALGGAGPSTRCCDGSRPASSTCWSARR